MPLIGQNEQAWIFFNQKPNAKIRLESPINFLSEKAILRKHKHKVPIDDRDLPLETDYVNTIKEKEGIAFLASSKWFNGIFVEGTQIDIEKLRELHFVKEVFYMDRSLNVLGAKKRNIRKSAKYLKKDKFEAVEEFVYGNTFRQTNLINLEPLHNKGYTGKGVTIAVVDAGFKNVDIISGFDRARKKGLLLGGYDFERRTNDVFGYKGNSHGTNVLSTMLGFVENEFIGTAPDASYYLFISEVAESETPKEEAYWIAAAEKADSLGVDIINTSLGYSLFDDPKYNYTNEDMNGNTTFISKGASIAFEKGMLVVNSAGNSGNSPWEIITAPADASEVLSIGAVRSDGVKASFSSFGPTADERVKPDVVAMGQNVSILSDKGSIVTSSGTSFSSPIIAGAIACLWQSMPDKTPIEVNDIVKMSGSLSVNPNINLGYGIPDFFSVCNECDKLSINKNESEENNIQLIENPVGAFLELGISKNNQVNTYEIFDVLGRKLVVGNFYETSIINVNYLFSGVYFLKLYGKNVNILRFVKK